MDVYGHSMAVYCLEHAFAFLVRNLSDGESAPAAVALQRSQPASWPCNCQSFFEKTCAAGLEARGEHLSPESLPASVYLRVHFFAPPSAFFCTHIGDDALCRTFK